MSKKNRHVFLGGPSVPWSGGAVFRRSGGPAARSSGCPRPYKCHECQLGGNLGPTWGHLGTLWSLPRATWGPFGGSTWEQNQAWCLMDLKSSLEPTSGNLGPTWGHLGTLWSLSRATWGPFGESICRKIKMIDSSWCLIDLESFLEPTWGNLGATWDHLGNLWSLPRATWEPFGGSIWEQNQYEWLTLTRDESQVSLGPNLGHLGPTWYHLGTLWSLPKATWRPFGDPFGTTSRWVTHLDFWWVLILSWNQLGAIWGNFRILWRIHFGTRSRWVTHIDFW